MSLQRPDKIRSFRDLEIWQRGIVLTEVVYQSTKAFPNEELYGLVSQLRRTAVLIPSNIAEGFARQHNKEYKQFLRISLGSCAELTTQVIIASKLRYIAGKAAVAMVNEIEEISRMTMSLIKKL
ncbi:MAG: four helix bundle protein [Sedimentisphaerales bacterium]